MAEYGDPIFRRMDYIKKYSLSECSGIKEISKSLLQRRRDDRVHPKHARKMAAKMEDQAMNSLFPRLEGGHGAE
jgi:prolyl oligopeptidase